MDDIQNRLLALEDKEYKEFTAKLIPNIDPSTIIGVRIPKIRVLAKQIYLKREYEKFLSSLPHKYHEENILHGCLIEQIKDFSKVIEYLSSFLPFVDNWAVCDTCTPKIFKKNKKELLTIIKSWIKNGDIYTRRYAIRMLMCFYLDDDFDPNHLNIVVSIKSDEYYLKMMVAWYFATALAKQWAYTITVFENRLLEPWTHNKAIQKAVESYRVTNDNKDYLRRLKIK